MRQKSTWWFQIFVYVHPYLGNIPNLTNIFSDGLVQPPTRNPPEKIIITSRGCGAPIHRSLVDQRHEANYWCLGSSQIPQYHTGFPQEEPKRE